MVRDPQEPSPQRNAPGLVTADVFEGPAEGLSCEILSVLTADPIAQETEDDPDVALVKQVECIPVPSDSATN
jgi:hypothetical protein